VKTPRMKGHRLLYIGNSLSQPDRACEEGCDHTQRNKTYSHLGKLYHACGICGAVWEIEDCEHERNRTYSYRGRPLQKCCTCGAVREIGRPATDDSDNAH
jgi:hypothetical protein